MPPPTKLLTPQVKALIGEKTPVQEMYGVVDLETIRRYVVGIPDQDPRHWDADLAGPRFGATTTPPAMVSYIATRAHPWDEDTFSEAMQADPYRDSVPMRRRDTAGLTPIRQVAKTRTHLHAGDEMEIFAYPKLGDRVFFQTSYSDIQEKLGSNGAPFLLLVRETRFWNQENQLLMTMRALGIER